MQGRLIVTEGGRERIHEICDDLTIIGSGMDADLLLKDPDAQPVHCEIRATADGYKLIDLETPTGILVNGEPVNQKLLTHGDTLLIGDARITYLGNSARKKSAPRHAPRPIMRELPIDENTGEVKRFYRHDAKDPSPEWVKWMLIAAGLCVLGLTLFMLSRKDPTHESHEKYRKATQLIKTGGEKNLKEAIGLLKSIPRGEVMERDQIQAIETAEHALFQIEFERKKGEANEGHYRVLQAIASNPDNLEMHRTLIAEFKETYPTDARIAELEAILKESGGGILETSDRFEDIQTRMRTAMSSHNWKACAGILREVKADAAIEANYGTRVTIMQEAFERQFRAHFDQEQVRALKAHAEGRKEEAISIFKALQDVGYEPYSGQAAQLLAGLGN